MKMFRFGLFLFNLAVYTGYNNIINLYVAIFLAVVMILEEIYDKAPKLSREDKIRIDKVMNEEYDRIMAERLKGNKNIKHFKIDKDDN